MFTTNHKESKREKFLWGLLSQTLVELDHVSEEFNLYGDDWSFSEMGRLEKVAAHLREELAKYDEPEEE